MIRAGDPLPEAIRARPIQTLEGEERPLGEFLSGPSVLIALRHFGCVGCDRHVTGLRAHLDLLTELGLSVVLVGSGAVRYAEAFAERHQLPERGVTLVTDPSLGVQRALQLERSFWSLLRPRSILAWLRAWVAGFKQYGLQGDSRQQGGALVIDGEGVVRFAHRSRGTGDEVEPGELGRHALALAAATQGQRARGVA